MPKRKWDRESCIQAVETFIQENGTLPKTSDLHGRLPCSETFEAHVRKSVRMYCLEHHPEMKTSIRRGRPPKWDRESCIQAVETFIQENGTLPTTYDLGGKLPLPTVFQRYVGKSVLGYCAEQYPKLAVCKHRWTKDEIRCATDAFYARHGRQARIVEHRAYNGLPSHNTIMASFNMTAQEYWDKFYPKPKTVWTIEKVVEALKQYHADNGHLPSQAAFFDPASQFPSRSVFNRISGGMRYQDFIRNHLPELARQIWTQERVLDALRQFKDAYGFLPRSSDFSKTNGLPSPMTLYKVFPGQKLEDIYARWLPDGQMRPSSFGKAKLKGSDIVQRLCEFVETNQRLPTRYEYQNKYGLPTYKTVKAFFKRPMREVYQELFPEYCCQQQESDLQAVQEPDESQEAESMVMTM